MRTLAHSWMLAALVFGASAALAAPVDPKDGKGKGSSGPQHQEERAHSPDECAESLESTQNHIIPSGREGEFTAQQYREAMVSVSGLLQRFGIDLGPVLSQVVKGTEMDELAAAGRPAVSFWSEGQDIFQQLGGRGLVYEFVAPTCNHRHAFYRDTLAFKKQISIVFHVMGHFIFGKHSRFSQVRAFNVPQEALKLYRLLESAYSQYGHDEVSSWYQKLQSLKMAQDMSRGTFATPEEIRNRSVDIPTASVLQAFVSGLPHTIEPWKREIAVQFEHVHRYYSGAAPTKIMNEGWAALMQELMPAHLPQYSDFAHAMEFADLMNGVAHADLNNPYWLGREAWRRVRARFNARAEIRGLSRFEQDRAFMQYGIREIISVYDDFDFLRFALDEQWVTDTHLALTTLAKRGSPLTPPGPPPSKIKQPAVRVVVSRDSRRVVDSIVRHVADLQSKLPRIVQFSSNHKGSGEVRLGFEDPYGKYFPLERYSMAQTLLVMSRIAERPVSIATVAIAGWPGIEAPVAEEEFPEGPLAWPRPEFAERAAPAIQSIPIQVRVEPSGKVEVVQTLADGKQARVPLLEKELEEAVQIFLLDLSLSESPSVQEGNKKFSTSVGAQMAEHLGSLPPMSLFSHSPTAARAISEYITLVQRRIGPALQAAVQGAGPLFFGKSGVQIAGLPAIPSFGFDRRAMQMMLSAQKKAASHTALFLERSDAPAGRLTLQASGSPIHPDDGLDLDTPQGNPGDPYWGEGGGGSGQGSGGEPGGEGAGQDGRFLNIPLEIYAKALQQSVELPRLRPKNGPSKLREDTREGYDNRRNGVLAPSHIAKNALRLGMALKAAEGKNLGDVSPDEALLAGMARVRPQDWVVRDRDQTRSPELNAMVMFMVDMSGSMLAEDRLKVAKRMVHDLRALLSAKYKQLVFRFVAFDGQSHVFETADAFFRASLGGGTDYAKGYERALEVQEKFPRSKWDRYSVTLGDMDDFGDPANVMQLVEQLAGQSEFTGVVGLGSSARTTGLSQAIQDLAQRDPYVSFESLEDPKTYAPVFFRKLFRNDENE